jgi:hypothetical protein
MIPAEIAELADLICPFRYELPDDDRAEIVEAAYRIWEAGWRPENHDRTPDHG